jgi:hypothetical protein
MNYLVHATPVHPSLCLQYLIIPFTIDTATIFILLLLLLFYYYHYYKTVATNKLLRASLFLGVAELTTHLLRLINILWLPLCPINKFGFYFPRRMLRSPILVGHQCASLWRRCGCSHLHLPTAGSLSLRINLPKSSAAAAHRRPQSARRHGRRDCTSPAASSCVGGKVGRGACRAVGVGPRKCTPVQPHTRPLCRRTGTGRRRPPLRLRGSESIGLRG